jgi:hypothetical protein
MVGYKPSLLLYISPKLKPSGAHMSLLSRLFGKSPAKTPEPELHKDFRIYPDPVSESGGYRIAARIEKDIDGETKTHQKIRADTYSSVEAATEASLSKAKQVIDQLGENIF